MTDEQINIAIAESLGWESCGMASTGKLMGYKTEEWEQLPNYTADLNACVEFVKTLSDDQRREYILRLCLGDDWRSGEINVHSCIYAESAPPRDRCETYLRTIRKEVTP